MGKNLRIAMVALSSIVATGLGAYHSGSEPPAARVIEQGSKIYDAHCRRCHLGGNTRIKRLNLVDGEWRHTDGSLEGLIRVVAEGIEATQMEPFKGLLSEEEIRIVSLYVLSLADAAQP